MLNVVHDIEYLPYYIIVYKEEKVYTIFKFRSPLPYSFSVSSRTRIERDVSLIGNVPSSSLYLLATALSRPRDTAREEFS